LAQQHGRPVAGFGAAGARLDVDKAVVGIGRITEHPAEFHLFDALGQRGGIGFAGEQRVFVVFVAGQIVQILGIAQVFIECDQRRDDTVQQLFLATQALRALRIVPDLRIFEFLVDFDQAGLLDIEVKDTPVARPRVRAGLPGGCRWR